MNLAFSFYSFRSLPSHSIKLVFPKMKKKKYKLPHLFSSSSYAEHFFPIKEKCLIQFIENHLYFCCTNNNRIRKYFVCSIHFERGSLATLTKLLYIFLYCIDFGWLHYTPTNTHVWTMPVCTVNMNDSITARASLRFSRLVIGVIIILV